ncbi:hypothetical protein CNMCM6069_005463 [Aspergillus lentulus]|nr:hypothetical protein CNMCM6069_005463 [Aspergillus lentulus]GFF80881.1 hypothetical protein IFM62136_10403 [Aspergillus lentulus]
MVVRRRSRWLFDDHQLRTAATQPRKTGSAVQDTLFRVIRCNANPGQLDKGRGPSQGYSNPLKLAHNPQISNLKEFCGMYRDDDHPSPRSKESEHDKLNTPGRED